MSNKNIELLANWMDALITWFRYSDEPGCLVHRNGLFLEVNNAWEQLTGYSKAELMELRWQDITHPEDLEQDQKNVDLVLEGAIDDYQMIKRYKHKQGHYFEINLRVMGNRKNAIFSMFSVFARRTDTDVSEIRQ